MGAIVAAFERYSVLIIRGAALTDSQQAGGSPSRRCR